MNMNFNYPTTIFRSIFAQMYKFLVEKYIFTIFAYELFKVKMKNSGGGGGGVCNTYDLL